MYKRKKDAWGDWKVLVQGDNTEVMEVNAGRLLVVKTFSNPIPGRGGSVRSYYSLTLIGDNTGQSHFWQEGQGVDRGDQYYIVRRGN